MARLTQSKLSHVNESQLRVWNPLFESKDSLRVKQHHIAPNTPRLKHQLLLSSKNVQQRHMQGHTTERTHRRFKCRERDQLGVLRITSNRYSVVKPQDFESTSSTRLRRCLCTARRRRRKRRPQHQSGRKSGYRSNPRGPPRSSESSRSRLQHVRTGTRPQPDRRAIIANHRSRPRLHCRAGLPAEIEPGDLLAIQAPSRCFGDPAMGKKSSRNPTSIGTASKLPSQLA